MDDSTVPLAGSHGHQHLLGTPSNQVSAQPVTLINVFRPKSGKLGSFLALQTEEARRLSAFAYESGWHGNRIHRTDNEGLVIIVTEFVSASAKEAFAGSELFQDHLRRITPLLEEVISYECALVEAHGVFALPPDRRTSNERRRRAREAPGRREVTS